MRYLTPVVAAVVAFFLSSGGFGAASGRPAPTLLFERGPGCGSALGDGPVDLYSVIADGSGLRRLTDTGESFGGQWSPDGSRIVFTQQVNGDCVEDMQFDLFMMRADGSHVRRLTRDGSGAASFSPDGRRLAFIDGAGAIVVSDTNAKQRHTVARGILPVWSPDGRRILFVAGLSIEVADMKTRSARRLAGAKGDYVEDPVWSPDGSRIAFPREWKRSGHNTYELWLMNRDGSRKIQLTQPSGTKNDEQPSWSPDGRQIVFIRSDEHGADLVLLTLEGRKRRTLLRNAPDLSWPTWSLDGSMIAFSRTVAGRQNLWTVRPDGTGLRRLTTGGMPDSPSGWRPGP